MKYPQGKLIKMMRTYAGLTLAQLGKRADLSITALSKLENGKAEVIGQKSRERLIGALLKAIDEKQARDKALADKKRARDEAITKQMREWGAAIARAINNEQNRQVEALIQSLEQSLAEEESQLQESKSKR